MRKQFGFTLLELMVTVAIGAILLGTAVPAFGDMIESNRRAAAINALISDLQLARSTAATRGRAVVVCESTNGTSCTGGNDFSQGWIVFVDDNEDNLVDPTDENGQYDAGTGETLLDSMPARSGLTMPANAVNGRLSFQSGSRSMIGATVAICPKSVAHRRWIVVNATGRPRLQESAGSVACPP